MRKDCRRTYRGLGTHPSESSTKRALGCFCIAGFFLRTPTLRDKLGFAGFVGDHVSAPQHNLRTSSSGVPWVLEKRGWCMELFYFHRDLRKDETEQKDPRLSREVDFCIRSDFLWLLNGRQVV